MLPKTIPMIIFFVDQNQKNLALSQILDIEKLKNVDGKTFVVKPNPKFKMPEKKMRDGGAFRGCGSQVKGKKFKGIF